VPTLAHTVDRVWWASTHGRQAMSVRTRSVHSAPAQTTAHTLQQLCRDHDRCPQHFCPRSSANRHCRPLAVSGSTSGHKRGGLNLGNLNKRLKGAVTLVIRLPLSFSVRPASDWNDCDTRAQGHSGAQSIQLYRVDTCSGCVMSTQLARSDARDWRDCVCDIDLQE